MRPVEVVQRHRVREQPGRRGVGGPGEIAEPAQLRSVGGGREPQRGAVAVDAQQRERLEAPERDRVDSRAFSPDQDR
jgi:hypothetical protein